MIVRIDKVFQNNPENIEDIPIFFIVGRGRSGSTFLRTILNAHPDIVVPLESRFVQYLYYKYGHIKKWTPQLALEAITSLNQSLEPLALDQKSVFQLVKQSHDVLSFAALCKIIYLSVKTENKKDKIKCIGDKNPRYSFFITQLQKIFPEARFIHLIRDYRDNLLSIKRVNRTIHETSLTPILLGRWKYYNQCIEKQKKQVPEKFYTLRFEDLIETPDKTLNSLCSFLGVEYNPLMLQYKSPEPIFNKDQFSHLHNSLQIPFNKAKSGEWQKGLTLFQKKISHILMGKYGKLYGYKVPDKFNPILWLPLFLAAYPLMFLGTIRYRIKSLLYRFPWLGLIYTL